MGETCRGLEVSLIERDGVVNAVGEGLVKRSVDLVWAGADKEAEDETAAPSDSGGTAAL